MDHPYIEENQVVDRYLLGTLPAAEAEPFEKHYLSCPECLDRLELAEAEQRAFKRLAEQEVERAAAARQLAPVVGLAWLARLGRLGRSRQAAVLAMALLVAVLLPWGLALRESGRHGRELAALRSRLEQEGKRSAAGQEAETARLRAQLASERAAGARTAGELAQARQPQGNVPILFLNAERGGPSAEAPTDRLCLPRAAGWAVLALEIDPPHQPTYRATLRDTAGKELWTGAGLRLDERDSLGLTLPTSLLAPGDHTLTVEGISPGRPPVAAGRFAFRVLPPGRGE